MTTGRPTDERELLLLDEAAAMRRLARCLVGPGSADDVVQDAQALALTRPPRTDAYLRPWLRATLRNLALTLRRGERRRAARERAVALPEADVRSDPAAIVAQAELLRDVAAAVHALDEPFRTVVVLRFWHNLLPEAIAAELGVPRNTVRSRLQRGLERLRDRLDGARGGRDQWCAPLAAWVGSRPAAPAGAAATALPLFAVLLMKPWLPVVAVLLVAAALGTSFWLSSPVTELPVAAAPPTSANGATAGTSAPIADERTDQPIAERAAAEATADDEPFDPSPVHVAPWQPDLVVVDEDDHPIAGALVDVLPGKKVERPRADRQLDGGARHTYDGFDAAALVQVRTGDDGRARPTLDLEYCSFRASKAGLGRSDATAVWHTRIAEICLVLATRTRVAGVVLRGDGRPAPGVHVTAVPRYFPSAQIRPEPTETDANGRFELDLEGRGTWTMFAHDLRERSLMQDVSTDGSPKGDVRIIFPGALTVSATVVDHDDRPIAGARVRMWSVPVAVPNAGTEPASSNQDRTDANGKVQFAVRDHGGLRLFADADDRAPSAVQEIEVGAATPHAAVRLVLPEFATIAGRVVHDDGAPLSGVRVLAQVEPGQLAFDGHGPLDHERFPNTKAVRTDGEGRFSLQVVPGGRYSVGAWPQRQNHLLAKFAHDVEAGRSEVVISIAASDLVGCVVRGRILRAIDGSPVPGQMLELLQSLPDGSLRDVGAGDVKSEEERFELPALPIGLSYVIRISNRSVMGPHEGPVAPTSFGPFVTRPGGLDLEVRMPEWGDLPVRILNADGSPCTDVAVTTATSVWAMGWTPVHPDRDGRALLAHRPPGPFRLLVLRGADRIVGERELTILPGRNPEVEICLPAVPPAGSSRR